MCVNYSLYKIKRNKTLFTTLDILVQNNTTLVVVCCCKI